MNYKGVIIEESLADKSVLSDIRIISTKIEAVTPDHKTPWLTIWTLHTVEIREEIADTFAEQLSHFFDKEHEDWYEDFKNDTYHYIVYAHKVFKVDLQNPVKYKDAKEYGISIGIPEYQVDFSLDDEVWKR
ncbi:hypothetical protein CO051_07295 [Candidatus Roizmanbacteria bacterium CG_4_9_14_0_2_um_filter_39_13]|uniref:Uncharacterized protein n=2 Tax=Candidatus Roizmaniibacteriota TaxID=1752723 RepID=A0A2M8EW77_9BACT|nr:MAG: hypothetical protein COY15_00245 [Candidatus Roizmanbacteria bacterium CG_4_10_14_0_2_um_filter_39_12]PJC30126.1 MAG: hypothetical protein CO051_07295 [Candidatus Roizmanbacteria bacterium CG_4_9_14_0_2_um_filter_39_13]PJE61531.1 MAG: hypothetical protein COU87_04000 [Candidatus Roizmanbacteria bacterium CG10_big_fil_rev_8_21_14_0_10_39_12]